MNWVEIRLLQHKTNAVSPIAMGHSWIDTENQRRSLVGPLESFEDFNRCGLAGTVLAKETENLPFMNGEIHIVHRDELSESLREVADFDDVRHTTIGKVR